MSDSRDSAKPSLKINESAIHGALIGVAFLIGINVHAYYDWTGADQSYAPPILLYTGVGILVGLVVSMATLPFLPIKPSQPSDARRRRLRLTIRTIMCATAGVAGLIVLLLSFPVVTGWALLGATLLSCVGCAVRVPWTRWSVASLLATQYLPFVWIFGYAASHRGFESLSPMFAGLPGHFPSLFVAPFFDQHLSDLFWLTATVTASQIGCGLWLMFLGPKRLLFYLLLLFTSSIFGSFILNAMVRA